MDSNIRLLLFFGYVVAVSSFKPVNTLCPIRSAYGYTTPAGDILLRYGIDALNITCTMTRPINSTQKMIYTKNEEELDSYMVTQVNNETLQLYVKDLPLGNEMYYCRLKDSENKDPGLICLNTVVVDTPPKNITDFRCIGQNNDNLTCSFTKPIHYLHTTYEVRLKVASSDNACKNCTDDGKTLSCLLSPSTQPQYRSANPLFFFTINMHNKFGNNTNHFRVEPFKHVIPNPPEMLTGVAESENSIRLSWKVSQTMITFSRNLTYRVLCQCAFKEKNFVLKALADFHPSRKEVTYLLTGLEYAHMLCDIRVALKSAVADPTDEGMWSKNSSITLRTKSIIPSYPPETDIGSFDVSSSRLIFWKDISQEYCNGGDFGYVVRLKGNDTFVANTSKSYYNIERLDDSKRHTFHIWAKNSEGLSKRYSTIVIPPKSERVNRPEYVVKSEQINGEHQLSWQAPENTAVSFYTVFWCHSSRDRPFPCHGNLNWTKVPGDQLQFNHTLVGAIYQYAVSANTETSSSGMVWAECTVLKDAVSNIRNLYSEADDTWMGIRWTWYCRNPNNKGEYLISYCPINKTEKRCKEPISEYQKNVTVFGPTDYVKITNLIPYTTYQISLFMRKDGEWKEQTSPIYNTTIEGAPSLPTNFQVINVTNSSLTVLWDKPDITNGVLKNYYLNINERRINVAICDQTCVYNANNLESYKNHTISVQACTVQCSQRTPEQTVTTKMGIPGAILNQPVGTFSNKTHMKVSWENPLPPRGKTDYYELNVRHNIKEIGPLVRVQGQQYDVSCSEFDSFYVSVRAVNLFNNQSHEGPWSPPLESYCKSQKSVLLYVFILVGVLGAVCVLYCSKRIYMHCQLMRDVEVKLPPGLAPVVTEPNLVPWNLNKHADEHDRLQSKQDEQVLLLKMKDTHHTHTHVPSADSSGCSSGHESVTSSLESGPVSSTDSGTDQLAEEIKNNSLRQRYVPGTKVPSTGYVLAPDMWGTKSSSASNYCKVGEPVGVQEESTSPYVTIDKASEAMKTSLLPTVPPLTPVSLLPPDILKKPNPGYVPYRTDTELVDPTLTNKSGYVVAGFPTAALTKGVELLGEGVAEDPTVAHFARKEFPWQQAPMETIPHTGYVSVGDAAPPTAVSKPTIEHKGGYVPHRAYEAKSIKED